MVMGDDSWMKGRGFESRRCMDIFHIDLVYCLFEKTENKLKRCRGRPKFKKNCFAVFGLSPVFVRSTSLLFCYLLSHSWNGIYLKPFLCPFFYLKTWIY